MDTVQYGFTISISEANAIHFHRASDWRRKAHSVRAFGYARRHLRNLQNSPDVRAHAIQLRINVHCRVQGIEQPSHVAVKCNHSADGQNARKYLVAAVSKSRDHAQRDDSHETGTEQDLNELSMVQGFHTFPGALLESLGLIFFLM